MSLWYYDKCIYVNSNYLRYNEATRLSTILFHNGFSQFIDKNCEHLDVSEYLFKNSLKSAINSSSCFDFKAATYPPNV
ncbi:hypothetical protein BpHYR1_035584 [Brachionus plicatilis]|uniref:Uncharacterized protein n=1 Tax=Brachionus plicatilis TaxID=10195 RepID=A0A3M7R9H4_BRAPC|nr:hypothetical protein BpHYR1_035584 [Brachionus plicatilis]